MKNVTAAILIEGGKILIARRKADDHLAFKWEFPGGKVEPGETPEECLKREMKEEFNVEVRVGDYFGESIYTYDYGQIRLLAYLTYLEKGVLVPQVHGEIKWVTREKLQDFDFAPADIPLVKKLQEEEKE
ncbi:MAG: 8-oxo-dGTP diphosphatase MutT [Clostridia bacterium]|nr:8-oxo-dGTP diphosphatase MutT [Clostridia bacterium]